ncbi:hypothetical protein LOAG_18109, partial [Loa loa]
ILVLAIGASILSDGILLTSFIFEIIRYWKYSMTTTSASILLDDTLLTPQ